MSSIKLEYYRSILDELNLHDKKTKKDELKEEA